MENMLKKNNSNIAAVIIRANFTRCWRYENLPSRLFEAIKNIMLKI